MVKIYLLLKKILTILRGYYRNKEIFLLDEPLANLDGDNQRLVMNVLMKLKKEKIVIVVDHS
ncbi:hypothetical protein LI951_02385 [Enterococcus sp. BWT-B8]|nr:hypothetical protein [Enterococcus sp. BWT-B8]